MAEPTALEAAAAAVVADAEDKESQLLSFAMKTGPPKRSRDLKLPSDRKAFKFHAVDKATR